MTADQRNVSTSGTQSSRSQFRSSRESEARILLLIDGFSKEAGRPRSLEGRVKLAKLDFLLRYPRQLAVVLARRGTREAVTAELERQDSPLESRMIRYRYGPWDPSYFAILGSLIGRGLVEMVPAAGTSALGYRTTTAGERLAGIFREDGAFDEQVGRIALLRRHLDLSGEYLKNLLYQLPEIADASWHEELR
jgi:hypothetical protein